MHQVIGAFHGIRKLRDSGVNVVKTLRETDSFILRVITRYVLDNAAIAGILRQKQRINLDVRQNALAVFAQALGHQLLNPQTQNAAALGCEERELVAIVAVVVVQERCQLNCGIVQVIGAAHLFGNARLFHKRVQTNAHQRRWKQAENRKRRVTTTHGRLAVQNVAPVFLVRLLCQT